MSMTRMNALGGTLAMVLGLAGCATPKPVIELANVSATNVSLVETSLGGFAKQSRATAENRADAIARLEQVVTDKAAEVSLIIGSADAAASLESRQPRPGFADLHRAIVSNSNAISAGLDAARGRDVALRAAIIESQEKIETSSKSLKTVAKHLADLGKEEDREARLAVLRAFIESVIEDFKTAKAAQEAENKAAADGAGKMSDVMSTVIAGGPGS